MKYEVYENRIEVFDKAEFSPKHILECGQVFRFWKNEDSWVVVSGERQAKIVECADRYVIYCADAEYFVKYFDLGTDYSKIKAKIRKYKKLVPAVESAEGLRILKQPVFETIVSFIISANNNIKRIKLILNRLAESVGTLKEGYYAFPTFEQMKECDEGFFKSIGAGYRAAYLVKFLAQYEDFAKTDFDALSTEELQKLLLELSGVGPKVANCILLFAFSRTDSFPVDTWMEKAYYQFFADEKCEGVDEKKKLGRKQISENLISKFGDLSGYVQQYLFYFKTIERG